MKYLHAIFVFLLLCTTFSFAAVSLIDERGSESTLKFEVPHFVVKNVQLQGQTFTMVNVKDAAYFEKKGFAALPFFTQSVMIPGNAAMGYEVLDVTYKEYQVSSYLPSKGVVYRNQDISAIPYVIDKASMVDELYPKSLVSLGTPYIMRKIRGIAVHFQPFQYNAAKGILKVAESFTVKLKQTGISTVNVLDKVGSSVNATFHTLYKENFINYSLAKTRYDEVVDGDVMVVVGPSSYKTALEPLIVWKNMKGIKTTFYTYPDETGGSGTSALQSFFQKKFEDEDAVYFLVVGDSDDISAPSGGSGLSDVSYVLFTGSDNVPDACLGRFCVTSASEAENMVSNVLKYEKEPDPEGTWYTRGIGHASSEGSPPDYEWVGDMRTVMLDNSFTEVEEVYQGQGGTTDQIKEAVNKGISWYNYMGHGGSGSFGFSGASVSTSTFSSFTNTDMLFVDISVACNNGEFTKDCIGENATRLDGTGALVFLGSYISQPWTPPQHGEKEMVRLMANDLCLSVGAIVANGLAKILDVSTSSSYTNTALTWTYFGDPSVQMFNDTPKEVSLDTPDKLETGTQNVELKLGAAVVGRVGFYGELNGLLACQMLDGTKQDVTVSVDVPDNENKVTVTVTGRNMVPAIKDIGVGWTGIINTSKLHKQVQLKQVNNTLAIKVPLSKKHTISVRNVMGQEVASMEVSKAGVWHTVDVPAAGMHLVSVTSEGKTSVSKYIFMK